MTRSKKTESVSVEIPEITLRKAKIRIVGDTALIVKAFSQKVKIYGKHL